MEGREPTPPADWNDTDDLPKVKDSESDGSDSVSPIGGPASEH
jgi:hypothetical protein